MYKYLCHDFYQEDFSYTYRKPFDHSSIKEAVINKYDDLGSDQRHKPTTTTHHVIDDLIYYSNKNVNKNKNNYIIDCLLNDIFD